MKIFKIIRMSKSYQDSNIETLFVETYHTPTPSGGVYCRAYFFDENRTPCVKAKAKYINIVEYDENNERINEVYGELGNS